MIKLGFVKIGGLALVSLNSATFNMCGAPLLVRKKKTLISSYEAFPVECRTSVILKVLLMCHSVDQRNFK